MKTQLESLLEEKAALTTDFQDVKDNLSDWGYDLFLNRIDTLEQMIEMEKK